MLLTWEIGPCDLLLTQPYPMNYIDVDVMKISSNKFKTDLVKNEAPRV